MERTEVILVDEHDNETGTCEKMEAHYQGLLHRAFSVFIFDKKGRMLLQQRAMEKYHSGGLWTNACCSHPQPGEETIASAKRRLREELGFETPIEKVFDFTYRAEFENGLIEHEFDHVFAGEYEGVILFNTSEVMNVTYKFPDEIREDMKLRPGQYTPWFHLAFPKIDSWQGERQHRPA
jgi:isopentenyl-diphosphate delta-isomerase